MLTGWIAAVIGIIIVVFSLNRLIREIRKGGIPNLEDQSFSDTFYALLSRVEQQGDDLDDINQTFYETVERLEKRIEALEKRLTASGTPQRARPAYPVGHPSAPEPEKPLSGAEAPETETPEETYGAAEIRKLLQEGKDSQQVARELNVGVGEVELIRRLKSDSVKDGPRTRKNNGPPV